MAFLIKPLRRGQLAATLDLAVARFRETQRLKQALEERKVIERAKGRLMERENLSGGRGVSASPHHGHEHPPPHGRGGRRPARGRTLAPFNG
jgi:ANTAR domain